MDKTSKIKFLAIHFNIGYSLRVEYFTREKDNIDEMLPYLSSLAKLYYKTCVQNPTMPVGQAGFAAFYIDKLFEADFILFDDDASFNGTPGEIDTYNIILNYDASVIKDIERDRKHKKEEI